MSVYHGRDLKKPTSGSRSRGYKVKRKALTGSPPTLTRLSSSDERVVERVTGGNVKVRAVRVSEAVVSDPRTGVSRKAKILRVIETPANREYARRNIIVKGALIETSLGKAVVTSRPAQDGVVNAVLLVEDKGKP
ncbi:MAG: 30S ribosomal protein S8e [Acidilobaceae archaeon]